MLADSSPRAKRSSLTAASSPTRLDATGLLHEISDATFRGAGDENEADLYAFVQPKDDQYVYLGNAFATSPLQGLDSQAATLGHEMSHFKSTGATDDHAYGTVDCQDLAEKTPDKALGNADNFNFYIENAP